MGQYQEWWRYHETEQQLQGELRQLESELKQLQAQLCSESPPIRIENELLYVLAIGLNEISQSPVLSNAIITKAEASTITTPETELDQQGTPTETISPALSARSSLSNFGPEDVPREATSNGEVSGAPPLVSHMYHIHEPIPSTPHSEMALLPEDMVAFFEEHTQTDPQLELPWWLRNITKANAGNGGPIDPESLRTNRLVQRWLQRWGRPSSQEQEQEQQPKEDHP